MNKLVGVYWDLLIKIVLILDRFSDFIIIKYLSLLLSIFYNNFMKEWEIFCSMLFWRLLTFIRMLLYENFYGTTYISLCLTDYRGYFVDFYFLAIFMFESSCFHHRLRASFILFLLYRCRVFIFLSNKWRHIGLYFLITFCLDEPILKMLNMVYLYPQIYVKWGNCISCQH